MDLASYATPGPLTALTDEQTALVTALPRDPVALCRAAQGLLVQPGDAFGSALAPDRLAERNTRPASRLLARAIELDPTPLDQPRSPERRVVGTCRHFAVLATAFLRAAGIPARARCGFAAYFDPPKKLDHWITEHWDEDGERWVRIDAEILDATVVATPNDLRPGQFLTGGEAWQVVRTGDDDPMCFGVGGTDHWGVGEIRGNAVRDLAALHKVEMLPWDEWGPMSDSYMGRSGDAFDRVVDQLAEAASRDDRATLAQLYATLAVPEEMID